MATIQSKLSEASLKNKRVLLRADLNVPQDTSGSIINDFRIKKLLPTIDTILEKQGKVILLTHCGRPAAPNPALSTNVFADWLTQKNYPAQFAPDLATALTLSNKKNNDIVVVENLRFFPGEKSQDKAFAQELAQLGDYYVNDAFALLHRNDSSVTLLPELFKPQDRTIGLLVEEELTLLHSLLTHAKHPFVVVQGGIKGETKLPMLFNLLGKADALLISTPLCFSFLKAMDKPVGKSLVQPELIPDIKAFLVAAQKQNTLLIMPEDYQVTTNSFEQPYSLQETELLKNNHIGVSIGPKSTQLFAQYLKKARTIFFNGMPGNIDYPETLEASRILLNALYQTNATCVIGGGDTVALTQRLGFDNIGYLSTGGGATLAYLSGQPLAGLKPFSK